MVIVPCEAGLSRGNSRKNERRRVPEHPQLILTAQVFIILRVTPSILRAAATGPVPDCCRLVRSWTEVGARTERTVRKRPKKLAICLVPPPTSVQERLGSTRCAAGHKPLGL